MPLEQYSSPCVLYSRLRSFSGIAVVCFTEHEGIWPFAFEHFLTHLTDKFALGNMRQMIMLKRYDAPFSPYFHIYHCIAGRVMLVDIIEIGLDKLEPRLASAMSLMTKDLASLLKLSLVTKILSETRPCDVLGVCDDANYVTIQSAYRRQVLMVHPDKASENDDELVGKRKLSDAFDAVTTAVQTLRSVV